MQTIIERLFRQEWFELARQGLEPRVELFSKRLKSLCGQDELRAMLKYYDQRYGHGHLEKLRQAGLSDTVIRVFSSPAA